MDIERAYRLARAKLDEHGLQKWDVMFDGAKSRFGCCWYNKQLITLSKYLVELNDETEVTDTILHELAHALVSGHHGHDKVWRQKALEIGCDGKRCYGRNVIKPASKYTAKCERCGFVYTRQRRIPAWRSYCCTECYRHHGVTSLLEFRTQGVQAIMS